MRNKTFVKRNYGRRRKTWYYQCKRNREFKDRPIENEEINQKDLTKELTK